MKQLTILCKVCGKVLKTKSYVGEFLTKALEVAPCKNCLREAQEDGFRIAQKEED